MEPKKNTESPKVSVIVNCYNGSEFLKECIGSVVSQDYENWELIFWDNNSDDDSVLIANSFRDKRIKIYKSENHTLLYEARNSALQYAKGDLVCFLDVDDFWHVKKLSRQILLHKNGVMASCSSYVVINEFGNRLISQPPRFKGKIVSIKDLLKSNVISIGTVCLDSEILNEHKFREDLNLIGDFEFWLRICSNYKIAYIDEVLEFSRQHQTNTSKVHLKRWIHEKRKLYFLILKSSWKAKTFRGLYYILKSEVSAIID